MPKADPPIDRSTFERDYADKRAMLRIVAVIIFLAMVGWLIFGPH